MAFYDSLLQLSVAQAITTTANSTNVYDVFGYGVGTVVPNVTGTTTPGADIGTGDGVVDPTANFVVTTAFAGGTSLQIAIQAAPDNGSGGAGTYVTLAQTQVIPVASLTKGFSLNIDIPSVPSNFYPLPRFYRFAYTVVGTMTAGNLNGSILLNAPSGTLLTGYPNNFTAI